MTRHDKWVIAARKGKEAFDSTNGDEDAKLDAARSAIVESLSSATTEELKMMVAVFTVRSRPTTDDLTEDKEFFDDEVKQN